MSDKNLPALIESKLPDVQLALPQGTIQADQLKIAFFAAFNSKPKLRDCSQMSLCAALINCAALGIIPETPEQHAYLIPRGNECQLAISYRGFCHMILRGGEVASIDSGIIHEGDAFEMQKGDPVICKFSPNLTDLQRHQKPVLAAYCLLVFKNGARKLEIMDADELSKVEKAMMNQNRGQMTPSWKMWRDEMFRKAPIKRIAKTSNLSPLVSKAAEIDNKQVLRAIPPQEKPLVLPSGEVIQPKLDDTPEIEVEPVAAGESYELSLEDQQDKEW